MKKVLSLVVVLILITVIASANALIVNGNFDGTDQASQEAWSFSSWEDKGVISYQNGKVLIQNDQATHSSVNQTVKVEKGKVYKVTANVIVEAMGQFANDGGRIGEGAYIGVRGTFVKSNVATQVSQEAQPLTLYIKTQSSEVELFLCLGGYSAVNTGKVYFDDVKMEMVDEKSIDASTVQINTVGGEPIKSASANKNSKSLWIILAVVIAVVIAVVVFFVFAKRKQGDETEDGIIVDQDDEDEDDDE